MVLSIGLQAFIPSSAAEWLKRGHTWVSCEIFSRRHVWCINYRNRPSDSVTTKKPTYFSY